jgi:hypothetical protein
VFFDFDSCSARLDGIVVLDDAFSSNVLAGDQLRTLND